MLCLPGAAADALAPDPDRVLALAVEAFMRLGSDERGQRCWAAPPNARGNRSVWVGPGAAEALNTAAATCGIAYDRLARAALAYATQHRPHDATSSPLSA